MVTISYEFVTVEWDRIVVLETPPLPVFRRNLHVRRLTLYIMTVYSTEMFQVRTVPKITTRKVVYIIHTSRSATCTNAVRALAAKLGDERVK